MITRKMALESNTTTIRILFIKESIGTTLGTDGAKPNNMKDNSEMTDLMDGAAFSTKTTSIRDTSRKENSMGKVSISSHTIN